MIERTPGAVVTGATGTIGAAIVRLLLSRGMRVIAAARTAQQVEVTQLFGRTAKKRLYLRNADVSNGGQAREMIAFATETLGRIDVLVNLAGTYGTIGPVKDVAPAEWKLAFDTNIMGCYNCCHYALPKMLRARRGKIINVAGGGSTGPLANFSSYAASKAAVARFTDTLASEVKDAGICVNAILPGTVDSKMQDRLLAAGKRAGAWYSKMKEFRETGKGFVPVALTADLVDFLLFGAGRSLTGKLLSARYDGFASWSEQEVQEIALSELFSLRRMDLVTLKPIVELTQGIQRFDRK